MSPLEAYAIDRASKIPGKNWWTTPKSSYQKYVELERRKSYMPDIDEYHEHTLRLCFVGADSSLYQKFKRLLAEWRDQAAPLSSITAMAMLPSYQEIIGMGKPALPLILNELKRKPSHLFWALRAISGIDPVPSKDRGNITQMKKAWIEWGRQNNIIE
jgi:hypothetical protein